MLKFARRQGLLLAVWALPAVAFTDQPTPIAVVAPDSSCPSREDLHDALTGRAFAVVDDGADLTLEVIDAPDEIRVVLAHRDGAVLLERTLQKGDCDALAGAIAFVVERRIRGVDWDAPAPAPPPPPPPQTAKSPSDQRGAPGPPRREHAPLWSLDPTIGVIVSGGLADQGAMPGLWLGAKLRSPHGLSLAFLGGALLGATYAVDPGPGRVEVARYPWGVQVGVSRRRPGLELDGELRGEVDVLVAESFGLPGTEARTLVALRVGPVVTIGLEVLPRVWISIGGSLLFAPLRYDLTVQNRGTVVRQTVAPAASTTVSYRFGL